MMSPTRPFMLPHAAPGVVADDLARVAVIADLFVDDDRRLDEAVRVAVRAMLRGLIGGIERDVRRHAARLLAGRGAVAKAERVIDGGAARGDGGGGVMARLVSSGVLHDAALIDACIGQVRVDRLSEALPPLTDGLRRPSLVVRLSEGADTVVAGAARAFMVQEARRYGARADTSPVLPAEAQHRLTWWVAAAIRTAVGADAETDRAIGDAAERSLAAHDEGDGVEQAAMRLTAAMEPLPGEWPQLLSEAIGDRRPVLFIALLAQALRTDFDAARTLLLDTAGDGLWLALRSVGMDRAGIARIALSLAEADPRRDIERFADRLDEIVAAGPDVMAAALAPLTLPPSFRAAITAVSGMRP